jgi:hypothetical protein
MDVLSTGINSQQTRLSTGDQPDGWEEGGPWMPARGAVPVDLVVAATAELFGLTLLHHDRDFATIARVTGQSLRWYGLD